MKHNISLVCKKSSCLPPVKTVLGQLLPKKIAPSSNPNPKTNPNSNSNLETIFLGGSCPDTGKNERNKKQKRNKK